MHYYRITKYSPKFRIEGKYRRKEWTSFSDVGKLFCDGEFKIDSYLKVENSYINAIVSIMKEINIDEMKIEELEKRELSQFVDTNMVDTKEFYDLMKNGMVISKEQIKIFSKLVLRELVWGKLYSEKMFVHFGYDFYMYIGTYKEIVKSIGDIEKAGLFLEKEKSPYL